MSCTKYRHSLQIWLYRHSWDLREDTATIYCQRGDAYVEMNLIWQSAKRLAIPEYFEAWMKMVHAQLDKYVDEAHCKETGGHRYVDGCCEKCWAWDLEEAR